ncbi:serine/threonine-protein kinase [Streptomyces sp. NBC_01803]|uniref:serine/threonine-protein kinase n=1 Tax=Streptomyces sp. NBC_01803 TaxID=2975946 RepID=UPI002DDA9152|nr:serine/threonine-protein kinase [Streptomyces sp. NBC_01803]WSA45837.1 serine/threonine protein kinase [Streptomyces sp. NBC_01803]
MGQDNGDIEPRDATPEAVPDDEGADGRAAGGTPDAGSEGTKGRLLNGRYRLGVVVGRGGMGTVWRARDEVLARSVAVKELRLPPGVDDGERKRMITRTLREAKAIATIRSQGVVTIYDVVDEGARPWIVMELIEGRSLADIIRGEGPMRPERAASIGLAILKVLRATHAAGVLHRDVKPSNVLIADEDGRVVLTDFGIAKVEGDPSITSTGMLVGAPSYISPERARGGAPGPPADMWSLGALLYCCVEGRPPYDEGGAIATLAAVMYDPVPPPRRAGPLTEVITGLLVKDPAGRLDEKHTRELLDRALAGTPAAEPADRTVVVGMRAPREPAADPSPTPAEPVAALPATAAPEPPPPLPPVAEPATTGPVAPPPDGVRRRRLMLIAGVVAVLLALLGAALASGLGDEDGGGTDAQTQGGSGEEDTDERSGEDQQGAGESPQDPAEDPGGEETQNPTGTETGNEDPGDDGSDADGDGPRGTEPETDPDVSLPGTPAGYARISDSRFHFRVSLPRGWERTGIAGADSGGIYSAADGGPPKVQIDFNSSPGDDAEAAWRSLEPSTARNSDDYELIGIDSVEWRGYPTVADWEFERAEDGVRVRVLNRGFRVDDTHGYAIMVTCPVDEWDDSTCTTLRETAFETFEPWD